MRNKMYLKLVRDRIPEIIAKEKCPVCIDIKNKYDLKRALKQKLVEETEELKAASNKAQLLEELADVCEVVFCLTGYNIEKLAKKITEKREEKGSFKEGKFLYSILEENDERQKLLNKMRAVRR